MSEPTLIDLFGAGATQTATSITIQKADLTGLVASATNRAESLLAAIVAKSETTLTVANQTANPEKILPSSVASIRLPTAPLAAFKLSSTSG